MTAATDRGRLDFFESALAFMAGYGIRSFLIAQSLNQIEKAYGQINVRDSCHVRVGFAVDDERMAKRVSHALGAATEIRDAKNYAGHRLSPWLGQPRRREPRRPPGRRDRLSGRPRNPHSRECRRFRSALRGGPPRRRRSCRSPFGPASRRTRAGRGERLKPGMLQEPRAAGIPRVGDKKAAMLVKLAERGSLLLDGSRHARSLVFRCATVYAVLRRAASPIAAAWRQP